MRTSLCILLVLLLSGAGVAFLLGRGRAPAASAGPASAASIPKEPGPSAANPASRAPAAASDAPVESRTPEAEPAAAPAGPLPGAAVSALFGGAEVYDTYYRSIPGEARKTRLEELDRALAEYPGDPVDRGEFEKYEALKEEAEWLRAHPGN